MDLNKDFGSIEELKKSLEGVVTFEGSKIVEVLDEAKLKSEIIDELIFNATINEDEVVKNEAQKLISAIGKQLGIYSASIHHLYMAMGRGDCGGFTVPAINIRALTYDTARAIFRADQKNNTGAVIFEIAKSEIGYTFQRPREYSTNILAAAIKEGHRGPVFIQGDHFQINLKKYNEDSAGEILALQELIKEAIAGEFYNIDIDASTLVDLNKPNADEEQMLNYVNTAILTSYVRQNEPTDITISIGGEIGEVGTQNSTVEELVAFMEGYDKYLSEKVDKTMQGISKISIQTGTSHGGIPLPDGTVADVNVDFDCIESLDKVAKEKFGLSGVVQHGASTLPDNAFHMFALKGASEVHLATGFQNMVYDSKNFPHDLKDKIYDYLHKNFASDKKDGETDEQFIYKTRKKGFGPFKRELWNMGMEKRDALAKELENRFDHLFKELMVVDTKQFVDKYVGK